MAGKGDDPRPMSVSRAQYASNYERIFGKKEEPVRAGDIFGSCGHTLGDEPREVTNIRTASLARDGSRAIAHHSACKSCRNAMHEAGCVLADEAAEEAWLKGALGINPW